MNKSRRFDAGPGAVSVLLNNRSSGRRNPKNRINGDIRKMTEKTKKPHLPE